MKAKLKKPYFVLSITESSIKALKVLPSEPKPEFLGLELEPIKPEDNDKAVSQKLNQALKKLSFNNNRLVLSLPRNQATCRFLKIPQAAPDEVERIVSLQASRYLPYPAQELITGYEIISTDKEGFLSLNVVIVHKAAVERYLRLLKEANVKEFNIFLSSYGLANIFSQLKAQAQSPLLLVDVDASQAEIAVISKEKLLFSRNFRINKTLKDWEALFCAEINNSLDAYLKETGLSKPKEVFFLGSGKNVSELAQVLAKEGALSTETLPYEQRLNLPEGLISKVSTLMPSFAALFGLALREAPSTLSLLTRNIKDTLRRSSSKKERIRIGLLILGALFIFGLGLTKNLSNKQLYLGKLKQQLSQLENEARPLEEMEKRLKLVETGSLKGSSSLELLFELHGIMPQGTTLVSFTFDGTNQVILRGQAPILNSVFEFTSNLENSPAFKAFNVKVRYATQKKTQTGEVVDFEIICTKA